MSDQDNRLMQPTPRGEPPRKHSPNHFEAAAYHMLGMFRCQRIQWGPGTLTCAEKPGSPELCAVCWYRQATGLGPVTREDLVKYMEEER